MINQNSVDYVNQSIFSKKFRKPTYENYSLANISNTLVKSLSGKSIGRELPDDVLINNKQYDHVFLFFL
ncbi:hypothetical protein KC909_06915, partial [Candidatus Dojkabacteria bacterium]|nr:hypothetical protein [Candidatus Dojkabacteria bacterium]